MNEKSGAGARRGQSGGRAGGESWELSPRGGWAGGCFSTLPPSFLHTCVRAAASTTDSSQRSQEWKRCDQCHSAGTSTVLLLPARGSPSRCLTDICTAEVSRPWPWPDMAGLSDPKEESSSRSPGFPLRSFPGSTEG
ncbi:uncharacterized protein MIR9-1HG isoform X7 [Rhinolophus ferrumequinum]|uniref:uncharacterized protein MIR9-1HG isoform X7 n=1 Tax=Rhinolophus ferrumequinum TaxID=59479 RepID=UPI00140FF25B|nr:uncharacterized protein MIR9-1HG isoform X7 [Rhinolophus ferrumequinum]